MMALINPSDPIERQNAKLLKITQSLMKRVEQKTEQSGIAYAQFERAALLETQVRERTRDLERTLDLLHDSNARLAEANEATETARLNLTDAIETISEGFALFDSNDCLVLSNSRFCREFLDIGAALKPGLPFAEYVRQISGSRFLSLPEDETAEIWVKRRLARHGDNHVIFNVALIWDRWLQVSEHRTSGGGTVILQTDVTDIIRMERQERDKLRDRQAEMVRATLEHLNQGVCIFDHDGSLVGWNRKMDVLLDLPLQRTAMGLKFPTLLERLKDQITFADGFDMKRLKLWASNRTGRRPLAFEVRRGSEKTLSVFAQEMPDRGFVISFTDVTSEREAARAMFEMNELLERRVEERTVELGEALAEAERANASKSRFVAAASHDLLQPLSAAKLFVSSLADTATDAASADVAAKAETALFSVEQIIEALLDISRLDAGKAQLDVQPVALSEILQPLSDELTPVATRKNIDLRIVPSSLIVESDPAYLRRIVQNLVSNAVRYTETGKVTVGVRRSARTARIEVWDTGPGIAERDQREIFQEFRRLDPSRSTNDGLGLGLAIVERACKMLGHPLELWSELGTGSCFSLNVGLSRQHKGRALIAAPADELSYDATGLVVLLVENDHQLARAVSMMIEGWNADVILVHSGEEALDLLSEIDLTPDAALLDYQLGSGMDGLTLLDRLRRNHGPVPARLLSADRSIALRQACAKFGVELINKPIDTDKLGSFLHLLRRSKEQ